MKNYIRVKTLLEKLEKLDPETPLFIQKDPEGNGYSPLRGIDEVKCTYIKNGFFGGEILTSEDIRSYLEEGYNEKEFHDGVSCYILFP